jgi:hypothetical protein
MRVEDQPLAGARPDVVVNAEDGVRQLATA